MDPLQYVKLRTLDLSWNSIERITGLEALVQLRELKLYHNKITIIENLTEYVEVRSECHAVVLACTAQLSCAVVYRVRGFA